MPYFDDPLDDEEQKKQNQISGAAPVAGGNGLPQQQVQNPQKVTDTGSHFVDLNQYLKNNNSQQFGQQVASKVQDKIGQANSTLNTANQNVSNQIRSNNQTPTQDQINSSIANPVSADAKQFQGWENQRYSGPTSAAQTGEYQQALGSVQDANKTANLANSQGGRETLLQSYFGNGGNPYTAGETKLDNYLLQNSGTFDPNKLKQQASGLNTQAQVQQQQIASQVGQQVGAVNQSAANARKAIGVDEKGNVIEGGQSGAIGQAYGQVNQKVDAANKQRAAQLAQIQKDFNTSDGYAGDPNSGSNSYEGKNFGLSDDEISANGLGQYIGKNIYGINLADYLTPGSATLNKNQVMTPEERARIQALSNLAGVTDNFASGAPQAADSAYTFNHAKLENDIAANKQAMSAAAEQIIKQNWHGPNPNKTMAQNQDDLEALSRGAIQQALKLFPAIKLSRSGTGVR